jgi:bifunctional DNase/RNase
MVIDSVGSDPMAAFRFSSDFYEENRIRDEDLIKLIPYGISLTQDPSRPTLLLRDEKNEHSLPVPLSPVEAGVTLHQSNKSALPSNTHKVTELLLETLNIKIHRCVFVEIRNQAQFVRLFLENHPSHGSLKVRADEAMSLCLQLNVEIFATPSFMAKSRVLNVEIEGLKQGLKLNPGVLVKHHQYIQ